MTLEAWYELKRRVKKEKDKARLSNHEMGRVKCGTLCKVEEWMDTLEDKNSSN